MDNRKNNGGKREGAGRPPKADEIKLIERLDKHIDSEMVFDKLEGLINQNNLKAIELYLGYRYGKPNQKVEQKNINYNHELSPEELKNFKKDFFKNY